MERRDQPLIKFISDMFTRLIDADADADADTLTQMALAAQDAAALVPPLAGPIAFDSWAELKAALDAAERPVKSLLRDRLERARPTVPWADELDADVSGGGELWVVDPLDGAVQYLQGLPQWVISIALIHDGRPVLAALHSPQLAFFAHGSTAVTIAVPAAADSSTASAIA